jgi:NAD(P)-dependent dehydrogenase (short-subunit alcohol dehydrogenase family)
MDYVLVTGGSHGIGKGIVKKLLEDGFSPIVLDVDEPDENSGIIFEKVNLSADAGQTQKVLSRICEKFEILRLVNNVGIVRPALLEDTTPEDFMKVVTLNSQTAMLCLQAVLPAMRAASFGRVVSITSRTVLGKEKRTAYSASKGALGAMTRTWALELAEYGITVNAVAPGPIATDAFVKNNPPEDPKTQAILERIPLKRMGTPADIAHVVSFFLDENSGFITGQTLFACGGISIGLSN